MKPKPIDLDRPFYETVWNVVSGPTVLATFMIEADARDYMKRIGYGRLLKTAREVE